MLAALRRVPLDRDRVRDPRQRGCRTSSGTGSSRPRGRPTCSRRGCRSPIRLAVASQPSVRATAPGRWRTGRGSPTGSPPTPSAPLRVARRRARATANRSRLPRAAPVAESRWMYRSCRSETERVPLAAYFPSLLRRWPPASAPAQPGRLERKPTGSRATYGRCLISVYCHRGRVETNPHSAYTGTARVMTFVLRRCYRWQFLAALS